MAARCKLKAPRPRRTGAAYSQISPRATSACAGQGTGTIPVYRFLLLQPIPDTEQVARWGRRSPSARLVRAACGALPGGARRVSARMMDGADRRLGRVATLTGAASHSARLSEGDAGRAVGRHQALHIALGCHAHARRRCGPRGPLLTRRTGMPTATLQTYRP
jgi:hypothetical protein